MYFVLFTAGYFDDATEDELGSYAQVAVASAASKSKATAGSYGAAGGTSSDGEANSTYTTVCEMDL